MQFLILSAIYFAGLTVTAVATGNMPDIGQHGGALIFGLGAILYSVFVGAMTCLNKR